MQDYILEMKDISKIYGNGIAANKDVDFNLKKGEIHTLVGENGAGKSTLMKVLFGMEPPSSGKIILRGENVKFSSSKDAIAHGIGMVHQHFMLVESFTAAQNIILGMEPKKGLFVSEEEAVRFTKELSSKYNLEVEAKAVTRTLPVGVKQKIEILKALARGAEILILDEPTAGLDPRGRDDILGLVAKLHSEQGMTIVLVSHSMEDVARYVSRLVVMNHGEKAFDGTPKEVFRHYKELETMGLAAPQITYVVHALRERGIAVDQDITTVEEARDAILGLWKNVQPLGQT